MQMGMAANVLVGLIAVEHVWILVLEMFLWATPRGLKAFGNNAHDAAIMAPLAKNQGLYNGFLAAGLFWGLYLGDTVEGWHVKLFFTACVFVAGVYGYATTRLKPILLGQLIPGALTIGAIVAASMR
jgi:putative membrane protein